MNKIYKVMYSKVKQCAVVVSEIAKSHGHNEGRSAVRKHTALTAAVLIALGTFTFMGTPTAQAVGSLKNNDFVGANSTYWYWDTRTNTWKTYDYKIGDAFNNRAWGDLPNYNGAGAKLPGSIAAGLYAQAGQQTITIGDRNAGQSRGSVFIGEHSGYTNVGKDVPDGIHDNYVTAVGFQSGATGWGSIAIGSNAIAENTKKIDTTVTEVGEKGNLSKVSDDVYGIEEKPSIEGASVALGYAAHSKDGNIAIGAYSEATEATAANKKTAYTGNNAESSYVSVGNSTKQRRISNVADGADVTDAATVGQLQALEKKTIAYNEGWGIKIGDYTKKDAAGNEITVKNAISVDRNLGSNEITTKSKNTFKAAGENSLILGGAGTDNLVSIDGNPRETQFGAYGKDSVLVGGENNKITDAGTYAVISGGSQNIASGEHSFIGGGWWNTASGATSTVLGGQSNTAFGNQSTVVGGESNRAIGDESTILGGFQHNAIGDYSTISGGDGAYTFGTYSSVSGGQGNVAIGTASSADGGWLNYSYGDYSQANGGYSNYTLGNASSSLGGRNGVVQGNVSVGIAGGSTEAGAGYALAADYQSVVTAAGVHKEKSNDAVDSYLGAGNNTGGNEGYKYTDVATALGYQATADAPNTVSFGHDKGDVSGYTVNWDYEFETDAQGNMKFDENGMPLVKSLKPNSITTNYYDTAKYNRLVKAADGIEDHDAVVMEQLKNASGVGSKIKVYQTDENGNIKFDKNNNPIEDTNDSDAVKTKREAAQKASEDAWGSAIGTGKVVDPNAKDKDSNGSGQLVTGGTVYNALQQQKTDLTDALTVKPGWGIEKTDDNTISVKHNLSTGDSAYAAAAYADSEAKGLILGGSTRDRIAGKKYGATTKTSVIVGARNALASNDNTVVIGGDGNIASGESTTVVGGSSNTASGQGYSEAASVFGGSFNIANGLCSVVLGGIENVANNDYSTNSGGVRNVVFGSGSINSGGLKNVVYNSNASSFGGVAAAVNGLYSTGIAGGSTGRNALLSFAAGFQSVVTDSGVRKTVITRDEYERKWSEQTRELGPVQAVHDIFANKYEQYDNISTALGYQATADEPGTIAFGHDAGDESGYTYEWEQLPKDKDGHQTYANDGTTNDYTKPPKSVKKKAPYTSAYYNRLVKIADGKDAHDAVTVEQLNKVQNDLDTSKTHFYNVNSKDTEAGNYNNDGAKGAGSMAAGFSTHADGIASTVTGSYSSVINSGTAQGLDLRGAAALSYGTVNVNQNTDPTKAYSGVANSIVGQANMTTNSNAAIIYGAGNTVTDSYRPIDEKKAAAIWGSVNDPAQLGEAMKDAVESSGGQVMVMGGGNNVESAYMTQVVGVGNTVKGNQVYTKDAKTGEWNWTTDTNDKTAIKDYDPKKSSQYNYVDGFSNEVINGKHDYVIGANNKLSGDSYDDDTAQPIKRSNRSNIVIGDNHTLTREQNTVIIGSSDTENTQTKARDAVIIGHNANATNDTGADNAVAIGLSATATGGNAVTIGVNTSAGATSITIGSESSAISGSNIAIGRYAKVYGDKVTNAVALGKLAEAHVADGVAIGSNSIASTVAGKTGYDAQGKTHAASDADYAAWVSTDAAVSVGGADHEVKYTDKDNKEQSKNVKSTRQITNLAAGTDDTDAVNVAQLKSLQSGLTKDLTDKGLTFVTNDGEHTAKLGSKVTIQGTAKKPDHEYTADNLTTAIDKDGNITILMDKDMSTEKLTVNGKDGKDGQPGTAGSIGIKGQDGEAGIGIDGKNGISIKGKDGKDGVTMKAVDGKDGTEGHIGLTGPKGTNGKDGTNAIDITVKNGYDGENGINGKNGVDGTSLTRIVYTDNTGEHQVATLEDGLKFKGDDDTVIAKKLNNTMEIIGGANSENLTDGNIGVNSTTDGKLKVQLAKDLTGITSISNQKTEGNKTTGAKITLGSDGSVDVSGGKITNVGSGVDASGNYTNTTNAANIGDVQNIVKSAVDSAADTTNKALADKANVDASNIGTKLRNADGSAASAEDQKANAENWGSAIGTGEIKADDGRMVTGQTVYNEVRPTKDGSYVKKNQTTGANLSALDSKIGKLDETKTYNYIDSQLTTSISDNLGKLDTHVKNNADAIQRNSESIQNITNSVEKLGDNAVQYDKDTNKSKVTLGGEGGTTITNVKDGVLNDKSTDAVNGKQLYAEQQARKELETKVTSNTTEINNIKDGKGFTDKGKEVIRDLAKGSVKVIAGTNTTVTPGTDKEDGAKTYAVNVEGKGNIASSDTGLISGDTLYKEVHVDKDGTYIKSKDSATGKDMTVAQNLSALDSGLKATSDLIHTNGDTIRIGGSSTATKIDVSGKDAKGNTTGRFITGVVTDAGDPTSAANVGYVNGVTAANTQQIYRDMNNAYGRLNNNINKAAAGSNALAALHPLDYDPDDKADFAVGYGHYRNANAAAVGAFYHPNENTMVNVGVSLGNGDPGFNAGVSFKVGRGGAGREAMSKTEMAKVINSQSKEIDALKKDNADKDKRIDALEQKMAEILAKLDKNGK